MKSAWVLSGAMFSSYLGISILAPVLPPLMRELGLSELQGGLILTGSSIMWVIFSPWWGRRSDLSGRKPVILLGLGGYALGVLSFALVTQAGLDGVIVSATVIWLLLVGARLIVGLLFSAAGPAAQAYIADVSTGQRRVSAMGILAASNGLATILGPALAALVVGFGLAAPIFLSAITPLLGMLLVWRLLPPVPAKLKRGERAPTLRITDPRLLPLLLIGFCVMSGLAVTQFTIGFLFQDRLGLNGVETARLVGLAVMASGVALLFAQMVLIQVFRLTPVTLLRLGIPLMLMVLTLAADFAAMTLALVLMGLAVGMVMPGFRTAITFVVEPHEQGAAAGLANSVPGYSFIFGPPLGTALYGVNAWSPYLLASLFVVAAFAMLTLHTRERAPQPAT
ncbi:MAG: MFS transporter [Anaerolineae bacterium]|nr:MFS transporter [Anaerolineae bacterium]